MSIDLGHCFTRAFSIAFKHTIKGTHVDYISIYIFEHIDGIHLDCNYVSQS